MHPIEYFNIKIYSMNIEENMTNWYRISDSAIVNELGTFLRQIRLQQNLTQQKLAEKAGLSRSAIHEMENGKSATSLITIVQVLRSLKQLQLFNSWKSDNQASTVRMTNSKVKVRLPATQKTIHRKKAENEWEWL